MQFRANAPIRATRHEHQIAEDLGDAVTYVSRHAAKLLLTVIRRTRLHLAAVVTCSRMKVIEHVVNVSTMGER